MMRLIKLAGAKMRELLLIAARRWLYFALVPLFVYSSLPWAAPALAKLGLLEAADFIYTVYSPFCHQFAFRSVFVFGEQAFYPRGAADSGYVPFEELASQSEAFLQQYRHWSAAFSGSAKSPTAEDLQEFSPAQQLAARHFIGDESFGYKTSLCARDLAIYSMLFVGGLVYSRYRWRIRPLPLWLYIFAGLGPVGLDGFSQLLSYPPFEFWPVRETAPLFRLITGGLFGLMSAWLGFPHLERSMQDLVDALQPESSRLERMNPPD